MTVSTTNNRVAYTGNASTTAFPFSYAFQSQAGLVVVETVIATGVQTTKTLTTDYTISGTTDANGHYPNGGTVNAVTAPAATVTWTIYRDEPRTQLVELVENDPLPAKVLEGMADKEIMVDQRLSDRLDRTLQQPEGDAANIGRLPAKVTRLGKLLGFDATTGDPVATDPASILAASSVTSPFMATALTKTTGPDVLSYFGASSTAVDLFVGDYGALGDGSTDDTAAFNSAVTAMTAGQVLRGTAGKTYILDGTFAFSKAGVLDMRGATLKLKASAGNGAKLLTVSADNVYVVGGTYDGNRSSEGSATDQNCIFHSGRTNVHVDVEKITNSLGEGFYGANATDCSFKQRLADTTKLTAVQWIASGAGSVTRCVTYPGFIDRSDDAANAGGCVKYTRSSGGTGSLVDNMIVGGTGKMHSTPTSGDAVAFEVWGPGRGNLILGARSEGATIGQSIANGQTDSHIVAGYAYGAKSIGLEIAGGDDGATSYCSIAGHVDGNSNTQYGASIDGQTSGAAGNSADVTVRRCTGSPGAGVLVIGATRSKVAADVLFTGAADYGVRLVSATDVQVAGTLDGATTGNQGLLIDKTSNVSADVVIRDTATQAVYMVQDAAGTLDNISLKGSLSGTGLIGSSVSGGGALGENIRVDMAGWSFGSAIGTVWDWKNFRTSLRGTSSPEGVYACGIGSTFVRTDGALGGQFFRKESGTGNTGWRQQSNRLTVEVTVGQADLASAASKTIVAGITGGRFKVRAIRLSGGGTNFSGGGGDRDIAVQDATGSTIWSVMTAAKVQSLAATDWGQTGVPFPATASHLTAACASGDAIVAKYSGGTTDYTAGSLTLIIDYERTT